MPSRQYEPKLLAYKRSHFLTSFPSPLSLPFLVIISKIY